MGSSTVTAVPVVVGTLSPSTPTTTGVNFARIWIDDVDVTDVCVAGTLTRRLNRISQAQVTIPYDAAIGGAGSRLKISFVIDEVETIYFHGTVLICETSCDEDSGTTVYSASDPMEMWLWRPARDYDSITPGNFVDPYFTKQIAKGGKQTGPQMVESMLLASENPTLIPDAAEGPLFIQYGTFEGGGEDLSGIPTDWPMTIAEIVSLLTSTGEVDVVLTPIDPGGGIMAQVDVYNGDFGTDLSGTVIFEFGMGARNVRAMNWNEDMSNLRNKIQYFFTPKETTRRYKANITGDDPCLPGNIGNPGGPGGSLPTRPNFDPPGDLGTLIQNSRDTYGVRMDIQTFDVDSIHKHEGCIPDAAAYGCCTSLDGARMLYRRQWQVESWLGAQVRELVHITPARNTQIGSFDVGDLVGVNISPVIRGGTSGVQRIYEYTISWESAESTLAIEQLVTSPTQEGI